ncbi:DedA family protein [Leucobacter allii]|uniref:DedA family protein n=1 Tax=Leucobacter allii TaxID=2932247 RepID=A0ABY4FR22_9MICO|nr:DedA family protein [Leucobacter allii]UOQ58733.1 DedA family protein [Leucobacter allii]
MTELLQAAIEAIQALDPALRTLIAGFGMLLETSVFVGLVIPGDTIALVAAIGVDSPAEFCWLVVALVLGAVAGESLGFLLGRWAGPRLRASRAGRRLGERNWRVAEHYLGERGGAAVFLSRFLPVLHSLVPLTAGMAGMRYRKFLACTAAASVVWALIVVSLGAGAAAGYAQLAGTVKGAGFIFAGAALLVVLALWGAKRAFLRREQRHMRIAEEQEGRAAQEPVGPDA